MKILHIVPGLHEIGNGIAVAAKLIASGQRKDGHEVDLYDAKEFVSHSPTFSVDLINEVWVHSMWTPAVWRACWKVLRLMKATTRGNKCFLVRMTHANLDPIRYRYHGWKKRLVSPVERWLFSRTDRVVTTGEWETAWCRWWGLKNEIEAVDIKRYLEVGVENGRRKSGEPLRVLYLGRRHPLKGVKFLERAVQEINDQCGMKKAKCGEGRIELREVSDAQGEELEKVWAWCDVLCLPTLSENFGLVVAEALEHGKPVITTDGAPAWEPPVGAKVEEGGRRWWDRVLYLRGYREGTDEMRVNLLKQALMRFAENDA